MNRLKFKFTSPPVGWQIVTNTNLSKRCCFQLVANKIWCSTLVLASIFWAYQEGLKCIYYGWEGMILETVLVLFVVSRWQEHVTNKEWHHTHTHTQKEWRRKEMAVKEKRKKRVVSVYYAKKQLDVYTVQYYIKKYIYGNDYTA